MADMPPRKQPPPQWHADALPRLGKEPDAVIARALNVTPRQVMYLRTSLKIEAACRSRWMGDTGKKIGVLPDALLAKELKVSKSAVQQRRKRRELKHERWGMPELARKLLGTMPDAQLAAQFGRTYDTVRRWRSEAKIPAMVVRRPWEPKHVALLGTMPDKIVARLVQRRVSAVTAKRESLKIPAFEQLPSVKP